MTTITRRGVEYRESATSGVYEPVGGVVASTTTVLSIAHIAGQRRVESHRMHQGDTPPPVLLAGRDLAGRPVSIGEDWTCSGRVIDARHAEVVPPRAITETTVAGSVTCFVARLTGAESDLLDPPSFAEYAWLVELANADRTFVDTVHTRLVVIAD